MGYCVLLTINHIIMTKLMLAAIAAITLYACSPKMGGHTTQTVSDANGNKMLLGQATKKDLQQPPFADWFVKNENAYAVDAATVQTLQPLLSNYQFTIFMGTWCGDSKREVPRLYKVLQACGVKPKQITLITVNNSDSAYKQSPTHEERGWNIHHVPTLIVREGDMAKGRIVETPVVSWEKDLLAIAEGRAYTPQYAGVEYLEQQFVQLGADAVLADSSRMVQQLAKRLKSEYEIGGYAKMQRTTGQLARALVTTQLNALVFAQKADAWYTAGVYQQMAGDTAKAKTYYQKALTLQPGHENATKKLAELN